MRTVVVLLLAALLLLVYGRALNGPFVYEDTQWAERHAPMVWASLIRLPGRALSTATLHLGDLPRWMLRLETLAVHGALAGLVFALTRACSPVRLAPWVATWIWLFHPLQSEAVLYLAARPDVLATLLIALAITLAVCQPRGWGLLAAGALTLALDCKESAVIGPALVGWTVAWRRGWRSLLTWRVALAGLVLCVIGGTEVPRFFGADEIGDQPRIAAFYAHSVAVIQHVGWTVLPYGLTIDADIQVGQARQLVAGTLVVVAAVMLLARLAQPSIAVWLVGCVALVLAPRLLLGLPESIADRHWYLCMFPMAVAGGCWLAPSLGVEDAYV